MTTDALIVLISASIFVLICIIGTLIESWVERRKS